MIEFRDMLAGDLVQVRARPELKLQLEGFMHGASLIEKGRDLTENGAAWSAIAGGRVVACGGLREIHPGQAMLWAIFSAGLGAASVPIARYARRIIARAPHHRLETLVDAEDLPAVRFAEFVGLENVHRARKCGLAARDHFLFERVS